MNDMEVTKQVQQMVQFIKQEAEEKANEISVAAEEEFNIEKLQLVEGEKRKIRQEYERKEKQVEVAKKIDYSKQLNASRLKVLQAQDSIVNAIKEAAEKELVRVSQDSEAYADLLRDLILQALLRLKEPAVILRCRKSDVHIVHSVLRSAVGAYTEISGLEEPVVDVDTKRFLPPGADAGTSGATCSGGIAMATKDGRIVCSNTLDARLDISFKKMLPAIRKALFPTSVLA